MLGMRKIDLTGKRFNRLTVLKQGPHMGKFISYYCKCDCGTTKLISVCAIRSGQVSCGCYRIERVKKLQRKYEKRADDMPEYRAWAHAKGRCHNPKDGKYRLYGARGIKMAEEWRDNFGAFFAHIGTRPEGTTLDRIDSNGDYAPGNVRWATYVVQNRNRRFFKRKK